MRQPGSCYQRGIQKAETIIFLADYNADDQPQFITLTQALTHTGLLLFTCLLISGTLSAQYSRSNIYLGQETSVTYLSATDNLFSQVGGRARGGFFLRDRLLVGATIDVGDTQELDNRDALIVAPFARYYLPVGQSRNFHAFGEVSAGYNFDRRAALTSLALGGEYWLTPGTVLTGFVRQFVGTRRERNLTSVRVRANVLLGQEHDSDPEMGYFRQTGDFFFNSRVADVSFGKLNGFDHTNIFLQLEGGIYLSNYIALTSTLAYEDFSIDIGTRFQEQFIDVSTVELAGGLRYEPGLAGPWQPYFATGIRYVGTERSGNVSSLIGGPGPLREYYTTLEFGPGFRYHLSRVVALDLSIQWNQVIAEDHYYVLDNRVAGRLGIVVFPGSFRKTRKTR